MRGLCRSAESHMAETLSKAWKVKQSTSIWLNFTPLHHHVSAVSCQGHLQMLAGTMHVHDAALCCMHAQRYCSSAPDTVAKAVQTGRKGGQAHDVGDHTDDNA